MPRRGKKRRRASTASEESLVDNAEADDSDDPPPKKRARTALPEHLKRGQAVSLLKVSCIVIVFLPPCTFFFFDIDIKAAGEKAERADRKRKEIEKAKRDSKKRKGKTAGSVVEGRETDNRSKVFLFFSRERQEKKKA